MSSAIPPTAISPTTPYATHRDIEGWDRQVKEWVQAGQRPSFMFDLDGCSFDAFTAEEGLDPSAINGDGILTGTMQELDALVKQGKVKKSIFAPHPRNVRMPQCLVDAMNSHAKQSNPACDLVPLTSRSKEDTKIIFEQSNLKGPLRMAFFDSGATAYVNGCEKFFIGGKEVEGKALNEVKDFLLKIKQGDLSSVLQCAVDDVIKSNTLLKQTGVDLRELQLPDLRFEPKNISINVHYREILIEIKEYLASQSVTENEFKHIYKSLDKDIAGKLESILQAYVNESVQQSSGMNDKLEVLSAPAAVEVKLKNVDKGQALALIWKLMTGDDPNSSHVGFFFGDDVCKTQGGKVKKGTDYFAFAEAVSIEHRTKKKFNRIHVLHPESGRLHAPDTDPNDITPCPEKRIPESMKDEVKIDLTMHSPAMVAAFISRAAATADREVQKMKDELKALERERDKGNVWGFSSELWTARSQQLQQIGPRIADIKGKLKSLKVV